MVVKAQMGFLLVIVCFQKTLPMIQCAKNEPYSTHAPQLGRSLA